MSCNHNNNSSYATNLASAARQNHKEKYTVVQGDYMKVNVMCISMYSDIGVEIHENEDQLITVVCGSATVKFGTTRNTLDCVKHLNAGDSVFIPAGTWHNVCNTGSEQLKLISVYAYGKADNGCGCTQTAGAQGTTCGCTHATVYADRSNVFNAGNYKWNDTQTRDNDCGCAINSGC